MSFSCKSLAIAVILALTFTSAIARADDELVHKQLDNLYSELKKAVAGHDRAAIVAMLTNDFVSIEVSGVTKTADQMIDSFMLLKDDPNRVSQTKILSISVSGDTALVTQRYHMETIKTRDDGTKHKYVVEALSDDEWKRKGSGWLLSKSRTNTLDLFLDSKSVMHLSRPGA